MRSVARRFRVCLRTVQRWVERARGQRLDRVDFQDRPSIPKTVPRRTSGEMEDRILDLRKQLRDNSDLGEFGALAIHRELLRRSQIHVPAPRTINRILQRHGVFDVRRRRRWPAPPRGWYLPDVRERRAELDQFDIIEALTIRGGIRLEVLTAVSLHAGLTDAWPIESGIHARTAREALVTHWRNVGLPDYAQFDNDTVFQGAHQHRDVVSSVMRLCLSLGVVPVFAPPRETGFQAAIESFNGRWQTKVFARFEHQSLEQLRERSARYVRAHRQRILARLESAPQRRVFPKWFRLDLQASPRGRMIFLRRTDDNGRAYLLGRRFEVDGHWAHRLVRCEVNLDDHRIRFYALRRRQPEQQPLLRETAYELPARRFREGIRRDHVGAHDFKTK